MADQIGKNPEDLPNYEKEIIEKLRKIQRKVEEIFAEEFKVDMEADIDCGYTFYFSLMHDKSHLTVHTGNSCPVCMVGRAIEWCLSNDLRHTENNLPLIVPMMGMGKTKKIPKKDLH